MAVIHLIERSDNVRKTDRDKNEWESGNWSLTSEMAEKLVGGTLYLHRSKQQPSHFGGTILSYRVEQAGAAAGLVVFKLKASMDAKGVKTERKGWAKDLKILDDVVVVEPG